MDQWLVGRRARSGLSDTAGNGPPLAGRATERGWRPPGDAESSADVRRAITGAPGHRERIGTAAGGAGGGGEAGHSDTTLASGPHHMQDGQKEGGTTRGAGFGDPDGRGWRNQHGREHQASFL